MKASEVLNLFKSNIPSENGTHMLSYFAGNAQRGIIRPFLSELVGVIAEIDSAMPGYADEMLGRLAGIKGVGVEKYEALLQNLAEIYVTQGVVEAAERKGISIQVAHEPGPRGKKNPECEAYIAGHWCALEVKTPKLIEHAHARATNAWQVTSRLPPGTTTELKPTLPRDNPVKDFLVSAEAKFIVYEKHRPGALRLLVVVWDDFCYEPIAALINPASGLLTANSFHRDSNGTAVTYSHVDGIIVIRHQHQLRRATREEPLIDDVHAAMRYRHEAFPPKAFIAVPGGRVVPVAVIKALNAVPLEECAGAEYHPTDLIMWSDVTSRLQG